MESFILTWIFMVFCNLQPSYHRVITLTDSFFNIYNMAIEGQVKDNTPSTFFRIKGIGSCVDTEIIEQSYRENIVKCVFRCEDFRTTCAGINYYDGDGMCEIFGSNEVPKHISNDGCQTFMKINKVQALETEEKVINGIGGRRVTTRPTQSVIYSRPTTSGETTSGWTTNDETTSGGTTPSETTRGRTTRGGTTLGGTRTGGTTSGGATSAGSTIVGTTSYGTTSSGTSTRIGTTSGETTSGGMTSGKTTSGRTTRGGSTKPVEANDGGDDDGDGSDVDDDDDDESDDASNGESDSK